MYCRQWSCTSVPSALSVTMCKVQDLSNLPDLDAQRLNAIVKVAVHFASERARVSREYSVTLLVHLRAEVRGFVDLYITLHCRTHCRTPSVYMRIVCRLGLASL